jgi:hypothetical protein
MPARASWAGERHKMSAAPCGKKRLRYGHVFLARLLLLISVAAGIAAVDDVQHRGLWLLLMLGWGALALAGSSELVLTDDGYLVTRAFGLWTRCYPHESLGAWATGSVPGRYGRRPMVWLRFRDGAKLRVDASDNHFFAQLSWQLNRHAHDLEVAPGAISFAARIRAMLGMPA